MGENNREKREEEDPERATQKIFQRKLVLALSVERFIEPFEKRERDFAL